MIVYIIMQGIVCSGIAYCVQGVVMKERGPVFVTAFNPLCMVIVAVLGTIILNEAIDLGRYHSLSLSFSFYFFPQFHVEMRVNVRSPNRFLDYRSTSITG